MEKVVQSKEIWSQMSASVVRYLSEPGLSSVGKEETLIAFKLASGFG